MAKGSPANPYAVGAPTPYGAPKDPLGGTAAPAVQQQQAQAAAPAQPSWGAQPAATPRAPATRDGFANTMAAAPAPVSSPAQPRAQATNYAAPAAAAYQPMAAQAAQAAPAAAPKAAAPAPVAAPKAATPAAAPKAATPAAAQPAAAQAAAPAVVTPAGPVVKPYVAPKTAAGPTTAQKTAGGTAPKATVVAPPKATVVTPYKAPVAAAPAPKVATAGPSAPDSVSSGSGWTAAQNKAGGRWETASGPYKLGRQWVNAKPTKTTTPGIATKDLSKPKVDKGTVTAPVVKDPVVTGLTATTGNSGDPGVITNHSGIGPTGTDLGVIGPIGGTPSVTNPNGTVTSIVSNAVNAVIPNITTEQWNKIKTKSHKDLLNSPDPVEQKLGRAIGHYTIQSWKSFDNAIGVGRSRTRSNSSR